MVENDRTKWSARPALIITSVRTGGTFLAHCLSNHPQMCWDRGEPLHHESVWCQLWSTNRPKLVQALTHQHGYVVSGVKLVYQQAFKSEIWGPIARMEPHIIWLVRENKVRQAVSLIINRKARRGEIKRAQHTVDPSKRLQVSIDATGLLRYARRLQRWDDHAEKRLTQRQRVLRVTYKEITGGADGTAPFLDPPTSKRICAFLGVRDHWPLSCELKRVNAQPLPKLIENWAEIRMLFKGTEFAEWV